MRHPFFLAAAAAAAILLLGCGIVSAMREVGGDEPVKDGPWPDGAVDVANLKSRFRYSSGDGGDTEFLYRGNTAAFQLALDTFAKVRAPALELVVHPGPFKHWIANGDKDDGHIDWSYQLHDPVTWHAIFNNPQVPVIRGESKPVPVPRIDVYVGSPPTPGGIDWTLINIPDALTVKDERLITAAQKAPPGRGMFHGVIYNMANGKTIAGATIQAQDQRQQFKPFVTVSADALGAYRIETLPSGQFRIVASAKGFAPRALYHQVVAPDLSMRLDGELCAEVTVKGTVTDEHDQPLKEVQVQIDDLIGIDGRRYDLTSPLEVRTDAVGRFTLPGMPAGFGQFQCTAPGLQQLHPRTVHSLSSWHKIEAGGREVVLTGDVRVDLRMAEAGRIHCQVTSADATPIDDSVNVTIADAEGGCSTGRFFGKFQRSAAIDRKGLVDFPELAPGRYFVTVGYWVDVPETQIVTVNAGKTTAVALIGKMPPKRIPDPPVQPVKPPKPPPPSTDKF